ncbi:MAG: DUF1616 domain-containing protein, partial [Chloroflexi bacterium]|nr:DUF1616 domain-containing protein [Chloroflexota bacterium]
MSSFRFPLLTLALAIACAALVLSGAPVLLAEVAGLLLVFVLPGSALLSALPDSVRPRDGLECIALAFGMSICLSMLCVWAASQVAGMGIITRWLVVECALVLVLSIVAINALRARSTQKVTWDRARVLGVALVLLVAALLRLPNLGYGEFYDDELDVVQSARSLLLGQTSVIFEHRKGPTEIWLTAVVAGTSTQFDEFTTRLPFVLASLGAAGVTALLGIECFGLRRGVLSGLLLAAEGIVLAFSRMVQYQG